MVDISRATPTAHTLRITGSIAAAMGLLALVLGLFVVGSLARDFESTMTVSSSAVDAIGQTIDVIEGTTAEIEKGIRAAARGVSGVSAASEVGAEGLANIADFLSTDLPRDLESISKTMPAAIQTAAAIDRTLNALSFVGVDYNPDEPFDASLRRVDDALKGLPENLRAQSDSFRELVPALATLADDSDRLGLALTRIAEDLGDLEGITANFNATLAEARTAIDQTSSALETDMWLLRLILIAFSVAGIAVGYGLFVLGRALEAPQAATASPTPVG